MKLNQRKQEDPRGALARKEFTRMRRQVEFARRPSRAAMFGYALGGLGLAIALGLGGHNINQIETRADVAADQAQDLHNLTLHVIQGQRDACEDTNTLRVNQGALLEAQVKITDESLRRDLGPALEPFRGDIVAQQRSRKRAIRELRADAARHPLYIKRDGELVLSPYRLNCLAAHPSPEAAEGIRPPSQRPARTPRARGRR